MKAAAALSIDQAAEMLGVQPGLVQPFAVADPFHDRLPLEGFLCHKTDHRYGAIMITRVADEPCPQLIHATPKLRYPFDRDGRFRFPPIARAHVYEKLDGTNVLAYRYLDAAGVERTTFKLRLHPVLRNGTFGGFLDMWRELLARHPEVVSLPTRNGCGISFELYGGRNPHLIAYDEPLALAVLFGVDPATARLIAPFQLELGSVPAVPLVAELRAGDDPVARFEKLRAELEARNVRISDEQFSGTEGAVWCVTEPSGIVSLWKCKPESIEEIHWAAGINKQAVLATCWNALETVDELSFDTVRPLLLEEYPPEDVDAFRPHVEECIAAVQAELAFRAQVVAAYEAIRAEGLSFPADKAAVMRLLAPRFTKGEMRRVYAALAAATG
jgi:hypothetical protein